MCKRVFTVALAAVLAFSLALPCLARNRAAVFGDTRNSDDLNLAGFSTLLNVTGKDANGGVSRFFHSYAIVDAGKTAVKWREIRTRDLTVELYWDISGLIKKPGKLILSSENVSGNTVTRVSDFENAGGSDGITYAVYTITEIAPRPGRIGKNRIAYSDGEAFIDIGAGREWSRDGVKWQGASVSGPSGGDGTAKWCAVTLTSAKQTVFVRNAGDARNSENITMSSRKSVRVTIPATPKAPRVNIYPARGFISVRRGMEISNDGNTWARIGGKTVALSAVTTLPAAFGSGDVNINLNNGSDVFIRNPASGGKPPSNAFATRIMFENTGIVSAEDFTSSPGKTIKIDSSVTIEAFMNGKWKKIKKLNADRIPDDGLWVRRAGEKDRMPGPERILRLTSQGDQRRIAVT
jgi:hypothetical protein